MAEYPSNETLLNMIQNSDKDRESRHKENSEVLKEISSDVKEIMEQTIKTNGRVSKLEWWRASLVWALGFLITLVGIAFPLLRLVVKHEIERSVNDSVISALSQFDIKVEK